MPACGVDVGGALEGGGGPDRVTTGEARRLGPGRGPEDPRRWSAVGRRRLPARLVGDDHGAGPVGRRAGLEEPDRLPHHRRGLDLLDGDVLDLQVGVGILQGVQPVLDRHLPADVLGCAAALDVGPDERGEGTAGTERGTLAATQGELGVALGLLLERHRQHRPVLAGLDVRGGDDGRRPAHRSGGVDPEHRLAHGTEGVGEVELGLHDALEEVGGLAEDDGVDVGQGQVGIVEGPEHRLAHQAAEGHVEPPGLVVGLAHADDGAREACS